MSAYMILMGVFFIQWLVFFPIGSAKIGKIRNNRQKSIFMIIVCIELICFAGLRAIDVGADTETYIKALNYYKSFPKDSILKQKLVWPFDFEDGYFLFTKICAWLSMNETVFLFTIAILTYIPVCVFIYRYSEEPLISVYTYFAFSCFTYSLGIFRQMMAISIILLGIQYIEKRELIRYMIVIGIAMLFHTTAIIMLPFYWIAQIRFKHRLYIFFILECALLLTSRAVILIAVKVFPKYAGYVGGQYDKQGGSYLLLIVYNLIIVVAYFMAIREKNEKDKWMHISFCATGCATLLLVLGYAMGIFGRIVPYYSIFLLILIPKIVNDYYGKNRIVICVLVTVCLIAMFYILNKSSIIVPYRTIKLI